MSAAERWEAAVRSALLGTDREPSSESTEIDTDASALDRALAGLEGRGSEARLLGSAAVLALYRRAGSIPRRDPRPLPEPAPEESARRASPAAARALARMMGGEGAIVIPEWMEMAAAREMVVPEELLPALLDAASGREEIRDAVLPVLGARGRWLAARNVAWAWAVAGGAEMDSAPEEDARAAWETGTADVRRMLLRRARKSDPALGLELVKSTWSTDAPKDRVAFLAELVEGLSDADEPFLESALDDRRKEVRQMAAGVLRRLPTSRLARRMAERARPLLRISLPSGGFLSKVTGAKPEIAVDLPAECTREMIRDGVEPKPPQGTGERAWWLQQVIAATPPSTWSADAPPDAWIAAAARSKEWSTILLSALGDAAERHRDAAWTEALIRARATSAWGLEQTAAALPADRYLALAAEMLAENRSSLSGGDYTMRYLAASPHPLGAEMTRALFARVSPSALVTDYALREQLRLIAPRVDPAAALEAVSTWEAQPRGAWLDLLHFRHALHEAFAS
ncbi:MAG TPA: DUF5691 domain-containing protein [Longimicrobium sp.]|nr:DUF5691 domain-containing protein [Longimicrobium sp.]